MRSEGLNERKIPMTQSGIETANFRLEAQYRNQLGYSNQRRLDVGGVEGDMYHSRNRAELI
jgi:hypothetical protein